MPCKWLRTHRHYVRGGMATRVKEHPYCWKQKAFLGTGNIACDTCPDYTEADNGPTELATSKEKEDEDC